jgi:Protein of unknown function (DUF5674)
MPADDRGRDEAPGRPRFGNLYPDSFGEPDFVEFDSMINVRPRLGNRSRSVEDQELRTRILAIVEGLVQP